STEHTAHGRLRFLLSLSVVGIACLSVLVVSVDAWYSEFGRDDPPKTRWHETTLDLHAKDLTGGHLAPGTINRLMDGDAQTRTDELVSIAQSHVLQGRDLRGAYMYTAVLPKMDLRTLKPKKGDSKVRTRLNVADLSWSQMQEVQLNDTDLRRANLNGARLQGATMPRAELRHAHLDDAQLQEATLSRALLDRASLHKTQLQGADLENTILVGAVLTEANLQGANLRGA